MADQYIYEPLSYRHEYCEPIRLLRVLPGKPGSMICCELFKTYLSTAESLQKWEEQYNGTHQHSSKASQNEEYYALSYVWGDAQDRVPVLEHSQIFWIDAICIDQTNLDERSRQVAFIADIYKEANTVLVWLEEEVAASPTAFTALSRPYDKHMLASEAEAIFEYFLAGYWDRLWVVQELYHARRIILRSGSLQLDWASISHTMIPGGLGKAYEIERHRERRRSCGSLTLSHMEANQAIEILETYGSRECLDPRDSVYGLRSLSPLFMSVVPDYSLSTAEVFTAATQAIISNFWSTYLLEVLEHVVRKKPSSRNVGPAGHLPSWVPDWTMPRTGSLHWLQAMPILASHKQKSTVLLSHDNPGVLPLCGIFVDTVTQVTRPYGEHAQPREGYTVVETVEQLQRWLPECEPAFMQEIAGRMLIPKSSQIINLKVNHLEILLDHYFQLLGYQGSFFGRSSSKINRNVNPEIRGSAVLITKTTCTGLVLGEPKVGDLVFVAYGADFPYIIRRTEAAEESYTFVGCAFISRMMDGEAIELAEEGKLREQTICLV